jgi:ABC-type molybdate transport system substrate-binding protein
VLERSGLWEAARAQAAVFKPTVNEVINDVVLGAVDVGVVWDPLVAPQPTLEAVYLTELTARQEQIQIGVLDASAIPTQALHFARFLAARDRGLPIFARLGYRVDDGDRWEERPAMTLYSGGVNRVAIQETIRDFEQREGCVVRVNYNGCGIHVSQMKALPDGEAFPDAYLACDVSFLEPLAHRFGERTLLSQTEVVILVPRANPHRIERLDDLARPGLRIGLCNVDQSTLGALTQRMLGRLGLVEVVESNVRSRTPTADLLVTQLDTGSLDAVVVYRANATAVLERHTALPINLPEARAVQPFAVAKQAPHARLAQRLLQALEGAASRRRYLAAGFTAPTP